MLAIAYEAIKRAGNTPCVLNAANEIAVAAFLHDKIGFNDIPRIAERTMESVEYIVKPTYEDYVESNRIAREFASTIL